MVKIMSVKSVFIRDVVRNTAVLSSTSIINPYNEYGIFTKTDGHIIKKSEIRIKAK